MVRARGTDVPGDATAVDECSRRRRRSRRWCRASPRDVDHWPRRHCSAASRNRHAVGGHGRDRDVRAVGHEGVGVSGREAVLSSAARQVAPCTPPDADKVESVRDLAACPLQSRAGYRSFRPDADVVVASPGSVSGGEGCRRGAKGPGVVMRSCLRRAIGVVRPARCPGNVGGRKIGVDQCGFEPAVSNRFRAVLRQLTKNRRNR